jgi:hypothetical protein
MKSHFHGADWAGERMRGISYLFFLRELIEKVETGWDRVLSVLEDIKGTLVKRGNIILNVTVDGDDWDRLSFALEEFINKIPDGDSSGQVGWTPEFSGKHEALLIPAHVNYVAKGMNLYRNGYNFHGSSMVILRYLRNTYFWDRIRVQGGAYGAFCMFDRLSGTLCMVSYRDPSVMNTVKVFDGSCSFLKRLDISEDELRKSIIGTIGEIDRYRLPDAKGFVSMLWHLSGETDEQRQQMRTEVLDTTKEHFRAFSEALEPMADKGILKILGPETNLSSLIEEGHLKPVKVL